MLYLLFFFFNDTATTEIYTLSLHDALPISRNRNSIPVPRNVSSASRGVLTIGWPLTLKLVFSTISRPVTFPTASSSERSEEHTSELQSPCNLVCRLLLEKKKRSTTESVLRS